MYNIITANNNNNKGLSGWAILWIPGFDVSVAGTGIVSASYLLPGDGVFARCRDLG